MSTHKKDSILPDEKIPNRLEQPLDQTMSMDTHVLKKLEKIGNDQWSTAENTNRDKIHDGVESCPVQ